EREIGRVQTRYRLAGPHGVADLDEALGDLSRHAESETRLVARAHFAGVLDGIDGARRPDDEDPDRPYVLGLSALLRLRACAEERAREERGGHASRERALHRRRRAAASHRSSRATLSWRSKSMRKSRISGRCMTPRRQSG